MITIIFPRTLSTRSNWLNVTHVQPSTRSLRKKKSKKPKKNQKTKKTQKKKQRKEKSSELPASGKSSIRDIFQKRLPEARVVGAIRYSSWSGPEMNVISLSSDIAGAGERRSSSTCSRGCRVRRDGASEDGDGEGRERLRRRPAGIRRHRVLMRWDVVASRSAVRRRGFKV